MQFYVYYVPFLCQIFTVVRPLPGAHWLTVTSLNLIRQNQGSINIASGLVEEQLEVSITHLALLKYLTVSEL